MVDELGDVLLQVILHSVIGEENQTFTIDDIISNLNKKIIRRHPHVFSSEKIKSASEVSRRWEEIKNKEKEADNKSPFQLESKITNMPSLHSSYKIGKKTEQINFDWAGESEVLEKVEEELGEKISDPWGSHAGEQESSAVMYFKEELINKERIGIPFVPEEYLKISRDPDVHTIIFNLSKYTETGTWGDASNASAKQGDIFYRHLSQKLAEKIESGWELP